MFLKVKVTGVYKIFKVENRNSQDVSKKSLLLYFTRLSSEDVVTIVKFMHIFCFN